MFKKVEINTWVCNKFRKFAILDRILKIPGMRFKIISNNTLFVLPGLTLSTYNEIEYVII